MRTPPLFSLLVISTALLASGCGGPGVTVDEAEEAFVAAFSGAYIGSFVVQLGREVDGVTFDESTDEMLFDGFDVSALGTQYATISGSAATTQDTLIGAFELFEGPVESISFELTVEQLRSESIDATIDVNGSPVEISVDMLGAQLMPVE